MSKIYNKSMRDFEKMFSLDKRLSDNYLADLNIFQRIKFKVKSFIYKHLGIWDAWDLIPYKWQRVFYDYIKPIYAPKHTRIRRSVPRTWVDISSLIEIVNFEMIKSFYEEEFKDGIVDWQNDERHREFAYWIEGAYAYITDVRPCLQKKMEDAYPEEVSFSENMWDLEKGKDGTKTYKMKSCEEAYGKTYEQLYGRVDMYETQIINKDTEILTDMIKYRQFFWT
jgi:hypothetical protein